MSKELIVSANRHETRVAVLEDDQVVEVYYQREKEYSLAGSIHKGRVTRVLPGMQSAFVDIGLDRDAFLYVSDFFEDNDEYDKIVTSVEEKVLKMEKGPARSLRRPQPVPAARRGLRCSPMRRRPSRLAEVACRSGGRRASRAGAAGCARAVRPAQRRRDATAAWPPRAPPPSQGRGLPESKYFSPGQHSAATAPPRPRARRSRRKPSRRRRRIESGWTTAEDIGRAPRRVAGQVPRRKAPREPEPAEPLAAEEPAAPPSPPPAEPTRDRVGRGRACLQPNCYRGRSRRIAEPVEAGLASLPNRAEAAEAEDLRTRSRQRPSPAEAEAAEAEPKPAKSS